MAFCCVGAGHCRALAKGARGLHHLLVAIDKLSKWVEVRSITNLRPEQAVTFFTNIIYRFGVPNSIITDNGSQFTSRKFLEFRDKFHIRVDWAVVAHPQTNGQVERANGMILQGLKPRIFDRLNKSSRKWLQELSAVVWSFRTTPSRATGFTPFFLVYGAEAVLPTDLEYGSPRVRGYGEGTNQRAREDSLDQLDEARTVAFSKVPTGSEVLPGPEDTAPRLQRRGPSPKVAPRQSRPPQAIAPMGGTLRRGQSA
jgi:transposase InsO family protein